MQFALKKESECVNFLFDSIRNDSHALDDSARNLDLENVDESNRDEFASEHQYCTVIEAP